jgi:hypothetical protein
MTVLLFACSTEGGRCLKHWPNRFQLRCSSVDSAYLDFSSAGELLPGKAELSVADRPSQDREETQNPPTGPRTVERETTRIIELRVAVSDRHSASTLRGSNKTQF